jgi:hypothetical protein
VLLLIGGVDLARMLHQHHVVTKSVQDGARFLGRAWDPTNATVQATARNLVLRGSAVDSAPPLLTHWTTTTGIGIAVRDVVNDGSTSGGVIFRGPSVLKVVVVSATVPFGPNMLGAVGFADNLSFTVSHEERHVPE